MSCYYYENTNTFSIHIPKCAGGSFDNFIKNSKLINRSKIKSSYDICFQSHLSLKEFKSIIFKEQPESYRSFAFIRNPYSRALSIYFWIKKNSKSKDSKVLRKMGIYDSNESVLNASFFDFWNKYAFNDNRFEKLTRLQSDYIEENTIKFKIESMSTSCIIKSTDFSQYEQIKKIYELMGAEIQKNLITNPINYEKQKVHKNSYNKKLIYKDIKNLDLIKEIYKKDFENLEYSY